MAKLTAAEKKWIAKVQALLNECPSDRIGFFAQGDNDIGLFDASREEEIYRVVDAGNGDFGPSADQIGARFDEYLYFPNAVHSVAG